MTAVDGLTREVEPGELVKLLGPSGCGKTTVLNLIAGFEAPDAGTIRLDGTGVATRPPQRPGRELRWGVEPARRRRRRRGR